MTPKAALSVDDRSDLYASLADQLDELKRHDEAVAAMRKRAAMLEAAAAAAPDVATAATFDAHRMETYLYLGEAPKAEALLVTREKEMPADYNPPARLARVLLEEKRAPEAEAAVEPRARAHVPGTAQGGHPRPQGAHPEGRGQEPDSGAPGAARAPPDPAEHPATARDRAAHRGGAQGARGCAPRQQR